MEGEVERGRGEAGRKEGRRELEGEEVRRRKRRHRSEEEEEGLEGREEGN